MKSAAATDLMNALYDEGFDATIDEDYSGRGMYGKTTYGVTTDASSEDVAFVCGKHDITRPNSIDNMGMSYIYY